MDVNTKETNRLTFHAGWDEHAQYSPDGTRIVWMSSKDNRFSTTPFYFETEFWIMDAYGNNKKRLSYFHQEGHQHYFKENENDISAAADSCWSPDGKTILGLVVTGNPSSDERDQGRAVMIELE